MRFRYLRDPLFLLCVGTYFVNRLVFKAIWADGFVHEHLNDLICIPFWVPIMLFAQRQLGLRAHDDFPRPGEIIIPLVVWSWVFEILLPATQWLGDKCVADYRDIFYYTMGALLALMVWNSRSRPIPGCISAREAIDCQEERSKPMDAVRALDDLCQEHKLDERQLAEKAGLEEKRVQAIVAGRWLPSPAERDRLAAVFGLTRDEIAWGHKNPVAHVQGHGPQFGRSP